MNAITYRIMDTIDEMTHVEQLQQIVWGMSSAETLGPTTIRWMLHIGGLLIGAWDDDQLVGFSIGTPGKREGKWVFWSDMAGTHPNYQSCGIGYQMKMMQKTWAREQGYKEIRWTFDPMQRGNASFNFHKLGVISYLYHPAFYGSMKDSINMGLPADRLEAIWSTTEISQQSPKTISDAPFAVKFDGSQVQMQMVGAKQICIQIPYDLNKLKRENPSLAIQWQQKIREAFQNYFHIGYQAIDFFKCEEGCWYILYIDG